MAPRRLTHLAAAIPLVLLAAARTSDSADTATETTVAATTATTAAVTDDSTVETGAAGEEPTYRATIRRTTYGIPHIEAADLGSVMFGQGYAFAEDRACTLLDQVVKVRSERSKWFGPGDDEANLTTDFAYLHLGFRERATEFFENDASPALLEELTGWVTGFNLAVAELGNDSLPGWCAGEAWADTTVSEIDLLMYFNNLMLLASSSNFLPGIGGAQPPATGATETTAPTTTAAAGTTVPADASTTAAGLGSNGWAIGSDWSTSGGGLLLANPHFPWEGELRLWESQLTIPGELDLYGASLSGVPGVLIGFTEQFGWTHTVSAGHRFTAYRLPLTPDDPTSYLYDGSPRAMTSADYTVEVLGEDGTISEVTRTLWDTHYGPVVTVGPLGWDASFAYAIRDANIDNFEALDQFLAMDTAQSFEEFQQAHADHNGIPWVNTIAVSADGRAWYADTAATPQVSDEAIAAYEALKATDLIVQAVAANDVYLFDGSDPIYEWVDSGDARDPGLVPYSAQPQIERADYVFNANNSYWLAHPDTPLVGYSPLHGKEDAAPGGRPHMNDIMLRSSAGDDGTYTGAEVEAALFSNRSLTGEQWRDAIVERCAASGRAELAEPCAILGGWDLAYHTDSVGAVLWTALLDELDAALDYWFFSEGSIWAEPWDPARPTTTPNGLAADDPTTTLVLDSLAKAATALDSAGIALDAPLGEIQRDAREGSGIGTSGSGWDDIANIITMGRRSATTLSPKADLGTFDDVHSFNEQGIIPVNYGSSFVMALEFTPDGPSARAVLTYGQPDDPQDPDFTSQTEVWSTEQLRPVLFTADDIADDPNLTEVEVSG